MPQRPPIELVVFRWKRPQPQTVRPETRARATTGTPEETAAPDVRWLVTPDEGTTYDPFAADEPLFRLFADLPPFGPGDSFERAAVTFAETWGLLGITDLSIVETDGAQRIVRAEPLDTWIVEARAMRAAVDLFDAVQKKNYDALRQWITAREDRRPAVYRYRREDAQGAIGGSVLRIDRSADPLRGLMAAARYLLWAEFINSRLREHVSLLGVLDHGRTQLRAVPNCLLGALWLQLARAADGNLRYRRCGYRKCQKWIEITGTFEGHTRAKRFCIAAHRVYEHSLRNPKRRNPKPRQKANKGRRR